MHIPSETTSTPVLSHPHLQAYLSPSPPPSLSFFLHPYLPASLLCLHRMPSGSQAAFFSVVIDGGEGPERFSEAAVVYFLPEMSQHVVSIGHTCTNCQ